MRRHRQCAVRCSDQYRSVASVSTVNRNGSRVPNSSHYIAYVHNCEWNVQTHQLQHPIEWRWQLKGAHDSKLCKQNIMYKLWLTRILRISLVGTMTWIGKEGTECEEMRTRNYNAISVFFYSSPIDWTFLRLFLTKSSSRAELQQSDSCWRRAYGTRHTGMKR